MDEFDIPIFKKAYELYKKFYTFRSTVSKQDRFTIWQRCEGIILDILEGLLSASQLSRCDKLPILEKVSLKLNFLRVFVRLMKEVKTIDNKKYVLLQEDVDEVGKMLGGWIKSTRER
ncbi:23S rRNA-intervening sequence protein [uncultured archaeon]|nr:23S rRNA-intervening sequence protein [uncultured archaeon]